MKPSDFLDWYKYNHIGSKRMHKNYGILRRHNPQAFEKLAGMGKFKYKKVEMGTLLCFPSIIEPEEE